MSIAMHTDVAVYDNQIAAAMSDDADFAVNLLTSIAKMVDVLVLVEEMENRAEEDLGALDTFAKDLLQVLYEVAP